MKSKPDLKILWTVFAILVLCPTVLHAESAASKNKTGNKLFAQGLYQDAEKAYLEAQALTPGKPELSYNLGNSLIRQKKYDQALQSLRSALTRGDRPLQADSWYNAGNALFDMEKFNDAAQAYIQALRLNPADRDAKHNLELALRKLEEQKQQNSQGPGKPDENQQKSDKNTDNKNPQDKKQSRESQGEKTSEQPERREGNISKERALQILDALKNQESADQRKAVERPATRKPSARDW